MCEKNIVLKMTPGFSEARTIYEFLSFEAGEALSVWETELISEFSAYLSIHE